VRDGSVEFVQCPGEVRQVEVEDAGQGRDGEERGGRDGAAFDLAEGVEGDAGLLGDGGGAAGAAGGAEDLAEGPAPVPLLLGEWGANYGGILLLILESSHRDLSKRT